jgi:hypothetical protein
MTPERAPVKNLYDATQARTQAERAAFLARATAGDDERHRDVEDLLRQPAALVGQVGTGPLERAAPQNLTSRRRRSFEIIVEGSTAGVIRSRRVQPVPGH